MVDSSVVGYQKPDKEIFIIAQARANVNPRSILFIDNSEEHIAAAKKMGWLTIIYHPSDSEYSTQTLLRLLHAT